MYKIYFLNNKLNVQSNNWLTIKAKQFTIAEISSSNIRDLDS